MSEANNDQVEALNKVLKGEHMAIDVYSIFLDKIDDTNLKESLILGDRRYFAIGGIFMQFYYGEKTVHRVLDEAEFWKQQEAEHTVVIQEIVPNLEPQFVRELEQFKRRFEKTKGRVVRYIETVIRSKGHISPSLEQEILQLIEFAIRESQQFINFLNRMLAESGAVRSNPTAQVVINHIRRESEYFIGIAQTILRAK